MGFLAVFLGVLLLAALAFLWVYFRRARRYERELKTLREELKVRLEAAGEEQRRKKDLVAFLAHDLKTPLTSVVGYLALLEERPDLPLPERRRFTTVALEKARRLEQLLGEFFDISRMELESDPQAGETVALSLLLEQLTDEFYPIFEAKDLTLTTQIQEKLTIWGEGEKLARVFDNLLRNAVSYSSPGGEVRLVARREPDKIRVTVSNEGLEIPEGELSNIFNKFYRLDAARSSATGGAGLGLAIAREIVEHHGGRIYAENTGRVTSFHVLLPAAASGGKGRGE